MTIKYWSCTCGLRIANPEPPIRCACGKVTNALDNNFYPTPKWVELISKWKKPEDIGVGDTLKRLIGLGSIPWFNCKCESRRELLNEKYPYESTIRQSE